MIRRPPRSTRTDTLSLHDALPICRQPELGDRCHIVDVAVPKTGFSADTFLIDLEGCATGVMGKRALVVRIERPGRNTFLGTSIVKQARMMQALSNHGISVPAIVGWEENASLIGGDRKSTRLNSSH